jgi:hypothetical protein
MAKTTSKWIQSDLALSGNPTAATQADADNSTRLATTAFVKNVSGSDSAKIGHLETLSGVASGSDNLGSFTGPYLSNSETVKSADQKLSDAAQAAQSTANAASTSAATANGDLALHIANVSNPHAVTKAQILTGNLIVNADVDNAAGILESKLALDYSTASLHASIGSSSSDLGHLVTLSGVAAGSDNYGAFTGGNLSASETSKSALQHLSDISDLKIPLAQKGAFNGVATLDGAGKIPVAQLPNSVMEFQGAWNASTNSPALADGVGNAGDVYRVSVAGSQDLGSGSIAFLVGDFVMYSGSIWERSPMADGVISVNGQAGIVVLDTDDIQESGTPTNLYFTTSRARTAAVVNTLSGSETDQAPSVFAVKAADLALSDSIGSASAKIGHLETLSGVASGSDNFGAFTGPYLAASESSKTALQKLSDAIVSAAGGISFAKEILTISTGDISAGYKDLAQAIHANSLNVTPVGGPLQEQGVDYTLSQPGAVTRVTFAGDLATNLANGDKVEFKYEY